MGSIIEINDTLKLKRGEGLPRSIKVGQEYTFRIPDRRLYHLSPVRVFLVEEIEEKWNYVGHAAILEQTIDALLNETRGRYEVVMLYPEHHVRSMNIYEAPDGKGFSLD